jgi:hypothetical protein
VPSRVRVDVACVAGATIALLAYWFLRVLPNAHGQELGGVDLLIQFLPDHTYVAERLRAGALPLWNPYQGQPFLATLLPGTFYPARLLLLPLAVPTAMHVSTLVHLVLGIAATYALCRALGVHPLGAVAAAITFTGIHALPNVYTPPFLEGGVWLPVAALALVRFAATGAWCWALLLGTAVGLTVLAGCYQHALYAVYGLAIVFLALLVDPARRGRLVSVGAVTKLVAAAVLAVATAAPQLLPTIAWLGETVRNGAPLTTAQLDPYPFPDRALRNMFLTPTAYSGIFVSIPVAVLALIGCVAARRSGAVLFVATTVVTLLLVGSGTPAFVLFEILPGFAAFRGPERIAFLVAFLMAVDVALAVGWMARRGRIGGAIASVAVAVLAWTLFAPPRATLAFPWTTPPELLAGPPALMEAVATHTGDGRTLLPGEAGPLGISTKDATMRHLRSLTDYNPLSSRRLAVYLNAIVGKPPPAAVQPDIFLGWIPMAPRIAQPKLLDAMAVRTILVKSFVATAGSSLTPIATHDRWTLYANPRAFPRAFTVGRAQPVADGDAALALLARADFDARDTVALATDATTLPSGDAEPLRPARIVEDEPERVVIDVDVARPSVLVLTDPIAAGWTATLNDVTAPVVEANGLARAVVVPAGRSRVEIRYRAPGLAAGLTAAAVAWSLVVVGCVWRRRGAR